MSTTENNLSSLLQSRLQCTADRVAYRFIEDEQALTQELTYGALHQQAMHIAAALRQQCKRGDRALMVYHSSREFIPAFFGCIYAGVIAVPAYPPRKNHNSQRLLSIIEDAGVSVVLSTAQIHRQIKSMDGYGLMFDQAGWINTDEVKDAPFVDSGFIREEIQGGDVMFLQYTSGSTGKPKGVIVTHDNIMVNLAMLYEGLEVSKESVYISWLPYFHDMGLIGVILEAMYAGVPAVMMSPAYFLQKPIRWLQAISDYGGTVSGAPNFAYDLCVDKIKEEDLKGIDLSTWNVAFNGSEPVSAKTLERFCNRFEKYGFKRGAFMPSFGLAEATLFVSGKLNVKGAKILPVDQAELLKGQIKKVTKKGAPGVDMVSCGITWHKHELAIVNPVTKERCGEEEVGELWFKGKSVAGGYWNKPEQSKETFEAYISNSDDGPYLRTGDLAFLSKGELYITGRLKDVIIIRGGNYYPQDLELTAWESHPDLSPNNTAVFSIDTKAGTQLVIVQEVLRTAIRGLHADVVFEAIISAISAEYQLQVSDILLLAPGGVLKTSSGKIQRQGNKQAYLNADFKPVAQWRKQATEMEPSQTNVPTTDAHGNELYLLENWIKERVAALVDLPIDHIRADKDFNSFGLDSLGAVELSGALAAHLGIDVPPNMIYDYPTITLLARQLASKNKRAATTTTKDTAGDDLDVAIIGISGRFPGAKDIEDFERLLFNGQNMVTTPGIDAPTDGDPRQVTYRSGYIPDVDLFDAGFFEIAPKEAKAVDPQQRLLLELCYVAMQHAGYAPQKLRGSGTGVFIGISNFDYAQLTLKHAQHKSAYFGTGVALSIAANRVSFFFDFKGPSLCIDTACSSSLVAVHQAVRSIRNGESTMALAGGVNLVLSDTVNEYLDAGQLLAKDGNCKTFDASADGYVRGEGGGVILLKSKKQAIKDGDNILAVIKGSAVVQDGHSNGLLAPNGVSQQQVLQNALDDARLLPGSICYVEAHGTGTALGDPIEVSAIDKVFNTNRDNPLIVGAVKANIGHLESAAGIAGLIKTVICLRKKQVPLQVHFKKHNPNISWDNLCVKIPTAVTDLKANGQPLRAGVSSFGFGGTNAHVVLEEYTADIQETITTDIQSLSYYLLPLSGKSEEALAAQVSSLRAFLNRNVGLNLNDLSYSLANTRDHFLHRLVVKCSSTEELNNILKKIEQNGQEHLSIVRAEQSSIQGRKALLFTGGGAQYAGMTEALYVSQPVFKEAIDKCIALANKWMEVDLKEILFAKPGSEEEVLLNRIDYMQPALFAYEYAMSKLWMSWGVLPDVLIGHSLGEIVAACVAGVFSLEDGIKLICSRGKLMQSLPPGGVMISLQANEEEVKKAIAGDSNLVSIAVINGPDQTVIAGEKKAAEKIKNIFDQRGVKTKTLQVSHASHSVLMDPILEQYSEVLASITFSKPSYTLISNVTGKEADANICTAQYWIDHLRNTVRFSSGIKNLETLGVRTLIEVGPHPVLLGIAKECMEAGETANWLPSARSADQGVLYDSLARYYTAGGNVDWDAFYKDMPGRKIALPTYPFQKESYWIDKTTAISSGHNKYTGKLLLGHHVDVAGDVSVYESVVSLQQFSYLADHNVMGRVLVPASFFCDMVQAYIRSQDNAAWEIEEILFEKPLILDATTTVRLQLLIQKGQEHRQFTIHSNHTGQTEESWTVLVQGMLRLTDAMEVASVKLNDLKKRYTEAISVQELYGDFAIKGIEYGGCFQSVEEAYRNKKGVLGKIILPDSVNEAEQSAYEIHPVLLDGSFQLFNAWADDAGHAYLPFSVEGYTLTKNIESTLWAEVAGLEGSTSEDIKSASITLWNEQGEWVGKIEKLSVKKADTSLFKNPIRYDYQYHLDWKEIKPERKKENQPVNEQWLVVANEPTAENVLAFTDKLTQQGVTVISSDDWRSIANAATVNKVVVFWNRASADDMGRLAEANALAGLAQLKKLISLVAKNLFTALDGYWWVTEGANQVSSEVAVDPSVAPLWGLGRVFMREHQDIPFKLLDVLYSGADAATSLVDVINSQIPENELAINKGRLYALRLASGLYKKEIPDTGPRQLCFSDSIGFDSLSFDPVGKKKLGENEVEIEVKYAGLNFRDIFRVLGMIAKDKGELGGECSGVITNVGAAVRVFKIGDPVMALAEGSFANVVVTDYRLVAKIPDNISLQEAATIPIAFLTAWYGFKNLADVQPGENVLIHSAAGGVGMAAIQIVQYLGGRIYGTASHSKWDDVRKMGVNHIYDSRTLDFYELVRKDTNGKGVDVVLNSFIDKFVDKSLSLLKNGGRFLEIGKRDIRDAHKVGECYPGITYVAYDLIYLMQHQQELIREMFGTLLPLFESKALRPLPATSFAIQNAQEAFQYMSKARHIGKVILAISETEEQIKTSFQLPAQSTVLIAGGLGGLGVEVAHYLVRKYRVGHLLLLGRREPSVEVAHELQKLQQQGVLITTKCVDITDRAGLADVIAAIPAIHPLKGVMHLAGMLDDAMIADQDEPRFMRVMAPKINGAWNLHELTKNSELELFVLFSSAASILGSVGQGNYAAANAFLDSLAYYRSHLGLPACSINWGPWESTGLVHRLGDGHKQRIRKQGIGLLSNEEGIALLDDILDKGITQPVLLPILKVRFNEVQSASPYPPASLFKDLLEVKKYEPAKKDAGIWTKQLLSLNPKQREQFLIETLQQEIARILSVPDAKKIHLDKSLQEFGMDSLMAVELRNKLSTLVGKKLPVTLLFDYPNVLALAAYLDGFIMQQENGHANNIEKNEEPGWRDAVYHQLMEELKKAGAGDDNGNAKAVKAMIDELNVMMGKIINGKPTEEAGALDDMSLEELESEFEKELKNI